MSHDGLRFIGDEFNETDHFAGRFGPHDLYAVVAPAKASMIGEDGIHLNPSGAAAVAEQTAGILRRMLS